MTVEDARAEYADVAAAMAVSHEWRCPVCLWLGRLIEAASLSYDLAVAEASMRRLRESVAWA